MNGIGSRLLHGAAPTMIALSLLCYGSIFVWSYVSFFFIETPARRWIDGIRLVAPVERQRPSEEQTKLLRPLPGPEQV